MKNETIIQAHEQGSQEWFKQRYGKFTASTIGGLMGIKGLGETGKSLAFSKAVELLYGENQVERFVSFDMQRGIDQEVLAFEKFKELKAMDFIEVEKAIFFPYGENAGASPDAIVGKDAIAEFKCPRSEKFFRLVVEGIDAIDKTYIYQMQMQLLCSNSERCHFFNYLIFNGQEMYHEIIVPRDNEMIEKIKERIAEAVAIRDQYVKELKANIQFEL